MSDQMQDHFEKLDEVYETIEDADASLVNASATVSTLVKALRQGRRKLRQTTEQLQADYGKMARARDAAIELLTKLGSSRLFAHGGAYFLRAEDLEAITEVIGLLAGSEEGEDESAVTGD